MMCCLYKRFSKKLNMIRLLSQCLASMIKCLWAKCYFIRYVLLLATCAFGLLFWDGWFNNNVSNKSTLL